MKHVLSSDWRFENQPSACNFFELILLQVIKTYTKEVKYFISDYNILGVIEIARNQPTSEVNSFSSKLVVSQSSHLIRKELEYL